MSDCVTLEVGGLVADGVTPDGDGIVYTVSDLSGWWDGPSQRVESIEVQPVGEVIVVARTNGRAPALTLLAHAPVLTDALGPTLCWTAINTVQAAFAGAVYTPVSMTVADPLNTQSADVKLVDSIRASILGKSVAVKFLILLLAPDPTFA